MGALDHVDWGVNSTPENEYYYDASGLPVWVESDDGYATGDDWEDAFDAILEGVDQHYGAEGIQAVSDLIHGDDPESIDYMDAEDVDEIVSALIEHLSPVDHGEEWMEYAESNEELRFLAQLDDEQRETYANLPVDVQSRLVWDSQVEDLRFAHPDVHIDADKLRHYAELFDGQPMNRVFEAYRQSENPRRPDLDDATNDLFRATANVRPAQRDPLNRTSLADAIDDVFGGVA